MSHNTDDKGYSFPDGGWECGKCFNYNFKGRQWCYRCSKGKDDDDFDGKPQHMLLSTNEKAALKSLKNKKKARKLAKKNQIDPTGENL